MLLTAQLISLAQRCPRFPTGFRSIHSATLFPCVFLFSQLVDDNLRGLGRHKLVWGQKTLAAVKQITQVAWRGTGRCPGSLWARSRVTDPEWNWSVSCGGAGSIVRAGNGAAPSQLLSFSLSVCKARKLTPVLPCVTVCPLSPFLHSRVHFYPRVWWTTTL